MLDALRDALAEQTGIRDYLDGEKVVHGFVAAYLSLVDQFLLHSEYELNKGYADLYLEPFAAQYPDVGYGYVLELKYLKCSEAVDAVLVATKVQEAVEQLRGLLGRPGAAAPLSVGAAYRSGSGVSAGSWCPTRQWTLRNHDDQSLLTHLNQGAIR